MDAERILGELLVAGITGIFTGLICWGAMRQDVKWLKESVTELRTLFFKYVQENSHNSCGKKG